MCDYCYELYITGLITAFHGVGRRNNCHVWYYRYHYYLEHLS